MNSITINLSDFYSKYKDWVRKNPQTASEIESVFKWLSYFVAGKINNSVILTESVYSASNLLVLFNDIIIQTGKNKLGLESDKIKIWLTVLEYSEVFLEISAKSLWGEKGKWIIVVCIQLFKCAARLILLLHHKNKIISCPPILPYKRNQEKSSAGGRSSDGIPRISSIAFSLKRSGRVIRKVDSAPPLSNRLWKPPCLSSQNNSNNVEDPEPDKSQLQQHLIGEMLYIMKPVVNLGAIIKYGQSTWKPWIISAAMDLTSLYLLSSKPKNQMKGLHLLPSQSLELSRRRLSLLLYLMRSPFYERHSKDRISSFLTNLSKNVPLARLICQPMQQYIPHWQETYFYLWSS